MIETDRLLLSPYTLADYAPYRAMCTEPAVMRFLGGGPLSAEDAWNRVLRYAGHWALLGYGMFAVREKQSGDYIGETGLADFRRGLGVGLDHPVEASWVFSSQSQGRGYAMEAASAVHRWYDEWKGAPSKRSICLVDPENRASLRLAGRLGYTPFADALYHEMKYVLLERVTS